MGPYIRKHGGSEGSASRSDRHIPGKSPGTHCQGDWLCPTSGLEIRQISWICQESKCGPSGPQPSHYNDWAIPTVWWVCKWAVTMLPVASLACNKQGVKGHRLPLQVKKPFTGRLAIKLCAFAVCERLALAPVGKVTCAMRCAP